MKKGVFFSILVLFATAYFIHSNLSKKSVVFSELKTAKEMEIKEVQIPNSSLNKGSLENITERESVRAEEVPPSESFENLREQVPSLFELEREYRNHRPAELVSELKKSQESIEKLQLIEKANAGPLSDEEKKVLMFEMRRQAVITQLQLKQKVQLAKRKYL